MLIVGDAFARPLIDQLRKRELRPLERCSRWSSGGAALNAALKKELLELLPKVIDHRRGRLVRDRLAGAERLEPGVRRDDRHLHARPRRVRALRGPLAHARRPATTELGWFAQSGRVPLGYLGDRAKTERTFPVIDGVRYSVPGDRARLRADGILELLGRDSVTINSGGEKIFAEEVEHALKSHPAVLDAVVCGRPSERWGNEVVAIVRLREGSAVGERELLAECEKHIARYKLPKAFLFRDEIVRSPSGKADYRWAKEQAVS